MPKTETAKNMVLWCTGPGVKKNHPNLTVTWEFLAYEAPPSMSIEFIDGQKHRFLIDEFSVNEKKKIIDQWILDADFVPSEENDLILTPEQQKLLEEMIKKGEWTPPEQNDEPAA